MSQIEPHTPPPVSGGSSDVLRSESVRDDPRGTWLPRVLFSVLPVLLTLGLYIPIGLIFGEKELGKLIGLMLLIFTALGKFAVFMGVDGSDPMQPYYIALLIVYMDTCVAFLVAFNLDWLYRVRGIGSRLEEVQKTSADILELNSWMRRATFVGVMLFVAFPLTGTGAIGGTLLGRMMGLRRTRIMVGILIGAFIGAFGMALGAHMIGAHLEVLLHKWYVSVPAMLILVALFCWINWNLRQKMKVARIKRETNRVEQGA